MSEDLALRNFLFLGDCRNIMSLLRESPVHRFDTIFADPPYNLSGNGDLVLQRDVPPGQAPYFAGSFEPDTTPEQIVLRPSFGLPDLRGRWFLGRIKCKRCSQRVKKSSTARWTASFQLMSSRQDPALRAI